MGAPRVGVAVAVAHGAAVLLVRRDRAPRRGLWALPGGAVGREEGLRTAAAREVVEETGLAVTVGLVLDIVEVTEGAGPGGAAERWVLVVFLGHLAAAGPEGAAPPSPTAGSDAAAAEWVPVDALAARPTVPHLERLARAALGA